MEEREIIELYLKRDQRAIEETDKCYKKYLLKIAMNILGDKADAEECLNDTYNAAWQNIVNKAPDDLRHYLARIIKNKALHMVEKRTAVKRGGSQMDAALDELEAVAIEVNNPEKSFIAKDESLLIECFLNTLSELDRAIFVRRYWFYEKIRDISNRYDIASITVNVRLRKLRKKLQEYLIQNGYEE